VACPPARVDRKHSVRGSLAMNGPMVFPARLNFRFARTVCVQMRECRSPHTMAPFCARLANIILSVTLHLFC
jgi:hypothetical protein